MIKTVKTYNFDGGGPTAWYPEECLIGGIHKTNTLDINTNQIVNSRFVKRPYVKSFTKNEIKTKYLIFFTDISYTFDIEYQDVEYYLTTFSDGSRIITLEKLIGDEE